MQKGSARGTSFLHGDLRERRKQNIEKRPASASRTDIYRFGICLVYQMGILKSRTIFFELRRLAPAERKDYAFTGTSSGAWHHAAEAGAGSAYESEYDLALRDRRARGGVCRVVPQRGLFRRDRGLSAGAHRQAGLGGDGGDRGLDCPHAKKNGGRQAPALQKCRFFCLPCAVNGLKTERMYGTERSGFLF